MAGERLSGAYVEITFDVSKAAPKLEADVGSILRGIESHSEISIGADTSAFVAATSEAEQSISGLVDAGENITEVGDFAADAADAVTDIGEAAEDTVDSLASLTVGDVDVSSAVSSVDTLDSALQDVGLQAEDTGGKLGQAIGTSATLVAGRLNTVRSTLEGIGPAGTAAAAGIERLGPAAGPVGALAAAAVISLRSVTNLSGEIRNFQQLSGASAEDASRFIAVLDDFQLPAASGANALFILGRRASQGAKALTDLGIEVAKNADGQVDLVETTLNVADAYAAAEDPAKRIEIAFAAFGKQGRDLIPLLEQGRSGLKGFFDEAEQGGQVQTQAQVDLARDLELIIDSIGDTAGGVARSIGSELLPVLVAVGRIIETVVLPVVDILGKAFAGMLAPTRWLIDHLPFLSDREEEVAERMGKLGEETEETGVALDAMAGFVTAAETSLANATEGLESFQSKLEATLGIVISTEEASSRYQEAIDKLTESLKENGNRFDSQTEKGRANRDALHGVIEGVEGYVSALVAAGEIQSTDEAQKRATIQRLRQMQREFPALKGELQRYIDAIREGIPSDVTTEFKIDDKQARAALARLNRDFDKLGLPRQAFRFELGALRGAQHGGTFGPGELVRVGEGGKEELVQGLPGGGFKVFPDAQRSATGVTQNIVVNEVAQDPIATARKIAWLLGTEAL